MGVTGVTGALRRAVSGKLAQWAVRRPHVLVVACPGATGLRLEAESAVTALAGRMAHAPADTDVLLVLGEPPGSLRDAVEELWAQVPGPRVRVSVSEPGEVERALREALPRLSGPEQETEARARSEEWHGGHEGMPGGLPMADVAADRDALKLDVLHVPLGPVLPYWPPGLVVDTRLQGDVVQQAEARLVGSRVSAAPPFWCDAVDPAALRRRVAAGHLDSMSRLLALVGWEWAHQGAVRLRNRLLEAEAERRVRADFGRWRRRVEGSVLMGWATDGLGVLGPDRAGRLGVGGPAGRAAEPWDATARWRQWLAETDALLRGGRVPDGGPRGRPDQAEPPSQALLAAVAELMPGLDLLDARLLMASFDPDPDEWARATAGTGTRAGGGSV